MTLNEELYLAQKGDQESFLRILERFKPTILKFSKELKYEEAESDLIIALLDFMRKSDKSNFILPNDGAAVNYIYKILKNKKNDLFRKNKNKLVEISVIPEILEIYPSKNEIEKAYIIDEALSLLNPRQKKIIILRYVEGYSDKEISTMLGISRQAIYKARNLGIEELRRILWKINS